ncbi:unnamed protein product [Zymoseptoria tritici ST99CH_1E4]|uniref:Uncharacterized protein n=1 Tax=Zymoseptoria tritici ST99CH_1E4 TaxID=1276532 RepID=A0A2H1HBS1_ZYMTR|nr:unnamed protein product [Zymoseptoria tritici ST99CH_1E4]
MCYPARNPSRRRALSPDVLASLPMPTRGNPNASPSTPFCQSLFMPDLPRTALAHSHYRQYLRAPRIANTYLRTVDDEALRLRLFASRTLSQELGKGRAPKWTVVARERLSDLIAYWKELLNKFER